MCGIRQKSLDVKICWVWDAIQAFIIDPVGDGVDELCCDVADVEDV